jgi:hypothetical protein
VVQRLQLRAPSGARVSIDLPGDAPVASVVGGVRFVGGSFGTGFQIGPRGYQDFACRYVAPATPRERFVVSGREVVVAEAIDRASSTATMMGAYHELMTVYAGPAPDRARVSALFGALRVDDHVDGMVVRPRAATLLDTMDEQIIVAVRHRGSVCVPGPRQARDLVPRHAGAPTRHGEVWKLAHRPTGRSAAPPGRTFVLGCRAGVAQVHLARAEGVSEEAQLDWLNELNVTWHDG